MLVTGYMAKQQGGSAAEQPSTGGGGLEGLLGSLLGGKSGGSGSGLASMLDLNGDGNPLDDIMRLIGKGRP